MTTATALTTALGALGAPTYTGYPPTGATAPYVTLRPLLVDVLAPAVDGSAIAWDEQWTAYCSAGSVEASYNLALAVMGSLHGAVAGGEVLATSIGYAGVLVEGLYDTQVTIQSNRGGL